MSIPPENLHRYCANYREKSNSGHLKVFLRAVKESRKFGYPMVCTLHGQTEQERMVSAVRLLLSITDVANIDEETAKVLFLAYHGKTQIPQLIEHARQLMIQSTATALTLQAFGVVEAENQHSEKRDLL